MLIFFLIAFQMLSCHSRFFIDLLCKPEYISEPGNGPNEKKNNYPKRSPALLIYEYPEKRAQENGNKHINAELADHHKRVINIPIIFHSCSPSFLYTTRIIPIFWIDVQ